MAMPEPRKNIGRYSANLCVKKGEYGMLPLRFNYGIQISGTDILMYHRSVLGVSKRTKDGLSKTSDVHASKPAG